MKLSYIFFFMCVLISCDTSKSEEHEEIDTAKVILKQDSVRKLVVDTTIGNSPQEVSDRFLDIDTIIYLSQKKNKRSSEDSLASTKQAVITKLPFFYKNVSKESQYQLPVIDTIIYYALDTDFERNIKNNRKGVLTGLTRYKNR